MPELDLLVEVDLLGAPLVDEPFALGPKVLHCLEEREP